MEKSLGSKGFIFIALMAMFPLSGLAGELEDLLLEATEQGSLNGVKEMIDRWADVEARHKWGRTALMYAAREGHTDIVALLEEAGARE